MRGCIQVDPYPAIYLFRCHTQVTAHQGASQMDPELSALEKQLLRNYNGPNQKEDAAVPNFEWHITMEYCDKGSLSHALSSFM